MLETGEAREVHHFALLIGYGGGAINPYLAFETLDDMIREERARRTSITRRPARTSSRPRPRASIKVMSKMGISAIQSYRGAQIFEAVGLRQDVIDEYFTWTASRIGGIGMDVIAQEVLVRHRAAFPERAGQRPHARRSAASTSGARTASSTCSIPRSIHALQKAVRTGNFTARSRSTRGW